MCYNTAQRGLRDMFQGFSDQTCDFMWRLAMNNERAWFLANREEFEAVLNQPFRALAADTLSRIQARHSGEDFQLHIARIYRDARRLYGRGPYKERLWFTIRRAQTPGGPVFWFELDRQTWPYGVGVWEADAELAQAWRDAIDDDPARFERIIDGIGADDGAMLWGQAYKRPKADRGEKLNPWYNRKNVSAGWEHPFGGALYDASLPDKLAADFDRLLPLFDFYQSICDGVEARRAAQRALSLAGE